MTINEIKKEIYRVENINEGEVLNPHDYVYFYINKETYNKPQYEAVMKSALEHVGALMIVIENNDPKGLPGRGIIDNWAQWEHTKKTQLAVLFNEKQDKV